jgi:hypothetical protein
MSRMCAVDSMLKTLLWGMPDMNLHKRITRD